LIVAQRVVLIAALAVLLAAGSNATLAEAPPKSLTQSCSDAGPRFVRLLDFSPCVRIGLDVTAEGAHHFADRSLYAESIRNADGSPSVDYGTNSKAGNNYTAGGSLLMRPHLSAVTPTTFGPLWIHVRPSNTSWTEEGSPFSSGPILVDDAFATMGAFTIGRRSSFFDYNPGFNHKPGYTSYRTTNVLAFTSPVYDGLTATFAVEDGSNRQREDGIWAHYGKTKLPDLVAAIDFARGWGNAHASLALHRLTSNASPDCTCPDQLTEFGFAASAGVEYRQKIGETHGRVILSAAAAEGALDYLGIPSYAPDFIGDARGAIKKTRGFSAMISYEHVWLPNLRTAASISVYGTDSAVEAFHWHARGYLAQINTEYMPLPNFIVGAELSRFFDVIRSADVQSENATMDQFLLYFRRFF
jgi:Porin subfamily